MTIRTVVVGAFALGAAITQFAGAQAPCSTSASLADSARADLAAVLASGSPLVAELRQEQGLAANDNGERAPLIKERFICARAASALSHIVAPGITFPVLRVGSMYYVRDPDQRQSTGVLTDSTFRVVLRLGRSLPTKR